MRTQANKRYVNIHVYARAQYIYILVYGNASADRAEGSDPSADKFAGSATRHTARHRPKPCTHGFGKCRLSMGSPRPYSRLPSWRDGQRTRRTTAYTLTGSRLNDCSEKELDHILLRRPSHSSGPFQALRSHTTPSRPAS